jgi:hypothetical protein
MRRRCCRIVLVYVAQSPRDWCLPAPVSQRRDYLGTFWRTTRIILFVAMLGGIWGCGSSAPDKPTTLPTNRFPKAGMQEKKADAKEKESGRRKR